MSDIVERLLTGAGGGKHWMDLHEEAADEITCLRSQVAEQEATIRRLQDRLSKDAETFLERVREAVEAEMSEALARVAECLAGMPYAEVSREARGKIYDALDRDIATASSPSAPNTQPACANGGESKPGDAR